MTVSQSCSLGGGPRYRTNYRPAPAPVPVPVPFTGYRYRCGWAIPFVVEGSLSTTPSRADPGRCWLYIAHIRLPGHQCLLIRFSDKPDSVDGQHHISRTVEFRSTEVAERRARLRLGYGRERSPGTPQARWRWTIHQCDLEKRASCSTVTSTHTHTIFVALPSSCRPAVPLGGGVDRGKRAGQALRAIRCGQVWKCSKYQLLVRPYQLLVSISTMLVWPPDLTAGIGTGTDPLPSP